MASVAVSEDNGSDDFTWFDDTDALHTGQQGEWISQLVRHLLKTRTRQRQ